MTRTHRRAVVVSLGDELTLGQSLDTNARWLAERLVEAGIIPVEHSTLPDDLPAIADAIRRSARRADLIVCTGGLGPTADDLTRDALADVTGEPLVEDPDSLEAIRSWFSSRGRVMLPANAVQARRPSGATALPNRHGTAPGILALVPTRDGPVECFCLPGPPSEMAPMFEESVAPRLRPPAGARIITRALHIIGLGESEVAARLGDLMLRDARILVGTTASRGIVTVRVRHQTHEQDGGEHARDGPVERIESAIRQALAGHILYEGNDSPRERLVAELQRRRLTLAVVESCTGGLLGSEITAVPGSSEVFAGGWITYSNDLKTSLVGVPVQMLSRDGAVSATAASAMAVGGLERSGASRCLAITGIAGPSGGDHARPVGTVFIALAVAGVVSEAVVGAVDGEGGQRGGGPSPPRVDVRRFLFIGSRETIRQWTVNAALVLGIAASRGEPAPALLRETRIPS